MVNPNVLSQRYATEPINAIFSEEGKTLMERELWIAVMKAQKELGIDIPGEDIEKFERSKDDIRLGLIEEIEKRTRHDVKAKIEAFVKISRAGEYIHKGMTSRDLTDNVEQMQIKNASKIVFGKFVSVLRHLTDKMQEYEPILLTGRSHHQPAQPILLGRRFSRYAEELYIAIQDYEQFLAGYPLRGMKGAMGTQSDMLKLFKGDKEKVQRLEEMVAEHLGFTEILDGTGQVYPRTLDSSMTAKLFNIGAACANFANDMRLMAGYELVTEGFKKTQVGSSVMPHKMNTRSSERICSFRDLLDVYNDGAKRLAGHQWEEGDVSCSVVRRVIIPDSFYVADGLCETMLTVLNEMGSYPAMIEQELTRYLPFLATTHFLSYLQEQGMGREEAHAVVKEHAMENVNRMRNGEPSQFAEDLGADPRLIEYDLTPDVVSDIIADREAFIGTSQEQILRVRIKTGTMMSTYSEQAKYEPADIL